MAVVYKDGDVLEEQFVEVLFFCRELRQVNNGVPLCWVFTRNSSIELWSLVNQCVYTSSGWNVGMFLKTDLWQRVHVGA